MDLLDIYCRKEARKRLEEQGFSPGEAFAVSEKVNKDVMEILNKDDSKIHEYEGRCPTCKEKSTVPK